MFKKTLIFLLIFFCSNIFAAPQKKLIVVLDWFINPNHAPLFIAAAQGFFAKENLSVQFITPADPSEGEKMVLANKADIAITYKTTLTQKIKNGLPLAQFATLIDRPLSCLVTLKNGPINNLKDIAKKHIGYSAPESDLLILEAMLKNVNLTLEDVHLINVKFNLTQSLLTGKIDAFIGGMRNFEPIIMELYNKPAKVFYPENHGVPRHAELIFVTNKNKIADPSLAKFVHALKLGINYLRKNPEKSWRKFAQDHPELNNELNKKSWFITLPYFAKNPEKLN